MSHERRIEDLEWDLRQAELSLDDLAGKLREEDRGPFRLEITMAMDALIARRAEIVRELEGLRESE